MSPKKHVPKHKPALKTVGGVVIPKYFFLDDKCLSGLSYTPTPDDVFITSYPKSGTTWTQYIVWEILNFGAPPPGMNDMLNVHVPFILLCGSEQLQKLKPPRAMKSHLPYHLQPYHHLAKYIYITRNPKDTCISFYHHTKEMPSLYKFSDGTLDDFFECFLLGEVGYGDWYSHVLSWYVHKDDPNVLFLTYESMKRDPIGNILNIAQFIGKEYLQRLACDPSLLARIADNTSFQNMKKLDFFMPKEDTDIISNGEFVKPKSKEDADRFYKVDFFWRGKVGTWKEYLSEEQVDRLNNTIRSRPRGQELLALWNE